MGFIGKIIGGFINRIVGWIVLGVTIGIVLLLAIDFFIGRPAAHLCKISGLCSPAKLPDFTGIYVPTVERIQALSELTTTRYNYANIVTGQTAMPALLSGLYGESLVMVAVVHIDAGIDVSQITDDDIIYDETTETVTITLPPATLLDCFLDEGESYIAQRSSGIFARPSPSLDTSTRRYALAQFRDQALEEGILVDASNEAVAVVSQFLDTVTDAQIIVEIAPGNPDAALPDTCG